MLASDTRDSASEAATIGAMPQVVREQLGVSIDQMGRLLSVSPATVRRWERGLGLPAGSTGSRRLAALHKLAILGRAVPTAAGFRTFLATPVGEFGGQSALQLIEAGQEETVLSALARACEGAG